MQTLIDAGRGEVEIIPVATLDEALAVLEELGGDPLVRVGVADATAPVADPAIAPADCHHLEDRGA